ncbi:MAG: calcium/sodium antiporter [Muribaculaceae bacterium]|nr:calcium/sodium antiporter [Muribaculaceae bacterium]
MFLSIIYLIVGLGLILAGANFLTDGSASVARRFGISDLVVGLTVVAFGTSTPELAISVVASAQGTAGLAVGNVVGSNIFNILAIIGVTAAMRPVRIDKNVLTTQIPLVILSSLLLVVMANGMALDGASENIISRVDGIILLIFFLLFMRETLMQAKVQPEVPGASEASQVQTAAGSDTPVQTAQKELPVWRAVLYIVGGLAALIFGGDGFVKGASAIASSMGVSDAVIGLTIVAVGTSLPELAASVVAALKGKTDLAVGNVIGSNVFNIFLVLGTAAVVRPLSLAGVSDVDLFTLMGASLLFWIFGWLIGNRRITRGEGIVMVALYAAYMSWIVISNT